MMGPPVGCGLVGVTRPFALEDQHYAGLVIWVGGRLVYLLVIPRLFIDWMRPCGTNR
ncbi:cytochrome c oxidase assembly protein [Methylocystis heyeri]|uniref:Uncharacterized protein n=1 Tax=Methylocystis heyeri TaxID=391905 RepID=A0A6B8KER0_9HYPH|nr:cytochrome c oxidase assembly protein [Methylocystis heyeri]QGM46776.1 hypothetical protein H2LOC_014335 [Methylocystis heyeri]